jgi:hypothetical protein
MSESRSPFSLCWGIVEAALQPLLRECLDGDISYRMYIKPELDVLVEQCAVQSHKADNPHRQIMSVFELMFVVRCALQDIRNKLKNADMRSKPAPDDIKVQSNSYYAGVMLYIFCSTDILLASCYMHYTCVKRCV